MPWNFVRLVLVARGLSVWRSAAAIAASEPGWLLLVLVGLVGGGAAAVLQLEPRRQTMALGAMALVLTLLLTGARRDARLLRIIGISPRPVRVIEALLWSCPLIGLAALHSLRHAAVIASGVAVVAFLSVEAGGSSTARGPRRVIPAIPASLPEWTVGLRRSTPLIVIALMGGIVGSGSPGVVVLALAVVGLTTSAFFWSPAEGWLLIHVRGHHARRFLSRKLLASVGMLSALVVPLVLLAALREPEFGHVYLLTLGICHHAHGAAVLVKYAGYEEGRPVDATGTLIWVLTAAAILLPPAGIVLLLWLYRRAAIRIADFCPGS